MLSLLIENTTDPVEVIQATQSNVACVGMFVCNLDSTTSASFDIYIVPSGKTPPVYDSSTGTLISGDESCIFIKKYTLIEEDTFFLNLEKILLHPGDAIYIRPYQTTYRLSVHVSYENY